MKISEKYKNLFYPMYFWEGLLLAIVFLSFPVMLIIGRLSQ